MNFNELTKSTEEMDSGDMAQCIDNLREIITEGKSQWDKVAAILQVDGDDVDAVFAAVRTAVAGMGDAGESAELQMARVAFPAFAELGRSLDAACLYEFERFNRHCDELAEMSVDRFIQFKQDSAKNAQAKLKAPRRWWSDEPVKGWRALCKRIGEAII